jgi:hypothetical protein
VKGLPDATTVVSDHEALIAQSVDLGDRPGAANSGCKVMTLLSATAIGRMRAMLGHRVAAPLRLGPFLRGYHPILATRTGIGEVLHIRARKGSANTSRGAVRFVDKLIPRLERAGESGPKLLRADSGFDSKPGCSARVGPNRSARASAPPIA